MAYPSGNHPICMLIPCHHQEGAYSHIHKGKAIVRMQPIILPTSHPKGAGCINVAKHQSSKSFASNYCIVELLCGHKWRAADYCPPIVFTLIGQWQQKFYRTYHGATEKLCRYVGWRKHEQEHTGWTSKKTQTPCPNYQFKENGLCIYMHAETILGFKKTCDTDTGIAAEVDWKKDVLI